MAKIEIRSKLIKSVYYQPESHSLDVNFYDGRTSVFADVPASVVDTLVSSQSPGWYYLRNIKGAFERM